MRMNTRMNITPVIHPLHYQSSFENEFEDI